MLCYRVLFPINKIRKLMKSTTIESALCSAGTWTTKTLYRDIVKTNNMNLLFQVHRKLQKMSSIFYELINLRLKKFLCQLSQESVKRMYTLWLQTKWIDLAYTRKTFTSRLFLHNFWYRCLCQLSEDSSRSRIGTAWNKLGLLNAFSQPVLAALSKL